MSRHRLYQNYDFQSELDDNDGMQCSEEEEDELSLEDKVQMDEGTVEVKRALGPRADDVTTKQIHDALWHYYYDVDKSVAYLLNKFIDPAPKPASKPKSNQKPTPSSDGMQPSAYLLSIDLLRPIGVSEADLSTRERTTRPPSMSDFFADMPWQNIPEHRMTVFVKPSCPSGGLLGGSPAAPKPSKLAALAAARKRKAEEATLVVLPKKKENNTAGTPRSETSRGRSSQDASQSEPVKRSRADPSSEGDTVKRNYRVQDSYKEDTRAQDGRPEDANTENKTAEDSSTSSPMGPQTDGASDTEPKSYMAKPSAFARVLCFKSASETPRPNRVYYPPWMAFTTPEALLEAFEKPSPDDVVLAAQSQGSRFAGESRP